jgi:O-antigen ligase
MEAILVIAAIAGFIWGLVIFLRGGLLGGCLIVLLAGTCFSVPFFKIELGPAPLTADRLLLVLLVVQYVFWRRWGLADPKPVGKQEIVLLLFLGVMVASTFTADFRALNYQPVSWLIIYYLMPAMMYWIARQSRYSEQTMCVLFGGMALFGIYLAVVSLAEYFKLWWLVFPPYIATTAATADAEFVGRARGPLLNPIANGVLLSACLGSALMWWPRLNRPKQLVLLAVAALCLAALYFSLTRSVWMGGIVAVALAVGLALPWNWRIPLLGGGLLVAVLLAATQWENLLAFKRDKALSAEQTADSAELRPIMAVLAWHMFCDRPIFGCGYAQYGKEHLSYLSDRTTDVPLERARGFIAHNVVFSLLTETGLVGFGLFATLVVFWTRDAWRLWSNTSLPLSARQQGLLMMIVLSVYFINGMFHDVSVQAMMNMTLFFMAGVTAGLRPLTEPATLPAYATLG